MVIFLLVDVPGCTTCPGCACALDVQLSFIVSTTSSIADTKETNEVRPCWCCCTSQRSSLALYSPCLHPVQLCACVIRLKSNTVVSGHE